PFSSSTSCHEARRAPGRGASRFLLTSRCREQRCRRQRDATPAPLPGHARPMSEDSWVPGRELDETIYRRLFERRTLLLGEPLEHWNSNRLCAGLLLLAAENPDADIRFLINSPGGSVPGMLAIRD